MQVQLANYRGWYIYANTATQKVQYSAYKDMGVGATPRTLSEYSSNLVELKHTINNIEGVK